MLSPPEKVRIRYHMGYPNLSSDATISAGVPPTQFNFRLEDAMNKVLPDAEDLVRELVSRCDVLDDAIVEARIRMQATSVEGITLRADEPDALEREYMRQVARLADTLVCTVNPFSMRAKAMQTLGGGPQVGNLRVRHS